MNQEKDIQFLDFVIKELVENPSDVKISRTVDEMGVLLTLDLNPADMGKIIGRMGNTAKAIRTLLRVVGMKNNARVNLKINEPAGSPKRDPRKHIVSFVYEVKVDESAKPKAGDDAATAKFYDLKEMLSQKDKFAFDHYEILANHIYANYPQYKA